MNVDKLLDLLTFNLDEYIESQAPFFESGILFKIQFKKPINNLETKIIPYLILNKNFIPVDSLFNLLETINLRKAKKQIPLIIDSREKINIFIQDEEFNFSFKKLLIEEPMSANEIKVDHILNKNIKTYFAHPDILNIINKNKYFYIKFEGLKIPPIHSFDMNLDLFLSKNIKLEINKINKIKESILFETKIESKDNRLIKKLNTIENILEKPKIAISNEIMEILCFYKNIREFLSATQHSDSKSIRVNLLKLDKMIERSKNESNSFKNLKYKNETTNYKLVKSNPDFKLIQEGETYVS